MAYLIVFMIIMGIFIYDNQLNLYMVILITTVIIGLTTLPLLYEIKNPKVVIRECQFVKIVEIGGKRPWGFMLKFKFDNEDKNLYIYTSKDSYGIKSNFKILLRKGEKYKVTFLKISKTITEIENLTLPIVNEIIEGCDTSNLTKKQKTEYSKLYNKYKFR